MKKLKAKIQGMHCKSCAILIEDKLKDQPGIIEAKIGFDSQKAVVVYDETAVDESKIFDLIKSAGDYEAAKIDGKNEENEHGEEDSEDEKNEYRQSQISAERLIDPQAKSSFLTGFLAGFSVFSLAINVFLGTSFLKNNKTAVQAQNLLSANILAEQPQQQRPSPQFLEDNLNLFPGQSFEITKENHVRGNFNAPITLVEFSDFECPFCARHFPTLNKILTDYKDSVRLVYKHFPLDFHPNSQKAAEASECADEQGKFWKYHDKLFENQTGGYSVDKFKQWAKELGINAKKFNDCLDTDKYAAKVQEDLQEGKNKGVTGTPATFVNGQVVSGALPYESFKQILDGLLLR